MNKLKPTALSLVTAAIVFSIAGNAGAEKLATQSMLSDNQALNSEIENPGLTGKVLCKRLVPVPIEGDECGGGGTGGGGTGGGGTGGGTGDTSNGRDKDVQITGRSYELERIFPDETGYLNTAGEQDDVEFWCPSDHFLYGITSVHDPASEDREFSLSCIKFKTKSMPGVPSKQIKRDPSRDSRWSNYENQLDEALGYTCPQGTFLVGMSSKFSDHHNDRQFRFSCSPMMLDGEALTASGRCRDTESFTEYDQKNTLFADEGAMIGITSFHHNHYEDRTSKITACSEAFERFTTNDNGLIHELERHTPEYTNWQNPQWETGATSRQCPWGTFVTSIISTHDNGREDRRFKLQCSSFKTKETDTLPSRDILRDESIYWSNYLNAPDQPVKYTCPQGKFLVGIGSIFSGHHKDRQFRFACSSMILDGQIVEASPSDCADTPFSQYDAPNSITAAWGAITSVSSAHHNHYEDRRTSVTYCNNIFESN